MDQIDLSDLFTTKAEATNFVSRVASISAALFQTNFNLEQALAEQFGINKADRFMTIMRENNINPQSTPAVKDFLFILMQKVNALPVLSITVAFEPQTQTLKSISEWFFLNMKKQILFEISVDKRLVGGAAITFNGKFYDFSIRPTFDSILKNYLAKLEAANSPALTQAKQGIPTLHQQPVAHPVTKQTAAPTSYAV